MNDKISIIIPVYNTAEYLDKCIGSVCCQTYRNLEIIIVDDGSTDNSYLICQRWAKEDDRIVLLHKENGGQSSARNLALDMAVGNYIGFVDSDDWIEPDMYEVMLKAIVEVGADAAQCKIGPEKWPDDIYIYRELLRDNIGSQTCKFLFSADLWKKSRFPLNRYAEDAAIIPVLLYQKKVASVDRECYHYFSDNPTSSSNAPEKVLKNTVDRAVMFAERYDWTQDKKIDEESRQIILSKAISFFIGAMGIYCVDTHPNYNKDISIIMSFARHNYWRILQNKYLSFARKVALSIICVAPKLYYRIRNIKGNKPKK